MDLFCSGVAFGVGVCYCATAIQRRWRVGDDGLDSFCSYAAGLLAFLGLHSLGPSGHWLSTVLVVVALVGDWFYERNWHLAQRLGRMEPAVYASRIALAQRIGCWVHDPLVVWATENLDGQGQADCRLAADVRAYMALKTERDRTAALSGGHS